MDQSEILTAIRDGRASFIWAPITIGRVRLSVFADALKVDGVRVPVTAETSQRAADMLDALLVTPAIEDAVWQQALLRPRSHLCQPTAPWAQIVERSLNIDRDIRNAGAFDIIAPVGKSWCISNKLTAKKALNYGLHAIDAPYRSATLPHVRVWQPPGLAHNAQHSDWSQLLRLVARACLLDGKPADLGHLLGDLDLAAELSHEGPLHVTRQPGVAFEPLSVNVYVMPELEITPEPKDEA